MMTAKQNVTSISIGGLLPDSSFAETTRDIQVVDITIDSRQVKEGSVFVAMPGVNTHGKQFIPQAIKNGACAIFVCANDNNYSVDTTGQVPVIAIPELESSLSFIADRFFHSPSTCVPVVGITGTNGKTTCSQLYVQLMSLLGKKAGVIGTMGYGICLPADMAQEASQLHLQTTGMTTPDAIQTQAICAQLVAEGSECLALEVSSHGLSQHRVAAIDINVAVFTNLTHDHLDYHGSLAHYAQAKSRLFAMPSVSAAVINIDDAHSQQMINRLSESVNLITYSVKQPSASLYLSDIQMSNGLTVATLHTPSGAFAIKTTLLGQFNLSNLLSVIGALYVQGVDLESIIAVVELLRAITGRMEVIPNGVNRSVVVDYAHTPDALENILLALRENTEEKIWCVFGCGGDRDIGKRPMMAKIAEACADIVVVTSDNPRSENPETIIQDICKGFTTEKHHLLTDRKQAIEYAITNSTAGDVIVIAGKGHEDYQLIDSVKHPFSDQQVAKAALRQLEEGAL